MLHNNKLTNELLAGSLILVCLICITIQFSLQYWNDVEAVAVPMVLVTSTLTVYMPG